MQQIITSFFFFCCFVHCSVDAFDPWVWVQTLSSFLVLLERFVEGVAWESLHLKGYKKKKLRVSRCLCSRG